MFAYLRVHQPFTRLPKTMPTRRFLIIPLLILLLFPGAACGQERRTPVVMAVAKAGPAVVNIRTEQIVKRRSTPFFGFSDPFFEQFFRDSGATRTFKTQALGSGVIIDPRGYVLTNSHVIDKASRIFVALPGNPKELEASLVGQAARLDLAVLKINAPGSYPALTPARSDDLMPGETVIAIGNPLGLGHSVTTGIVSAPRRRIAMDEAHTSFFIQTDALINPGNSGGPLLNINGELIGINTAIVSQAQGIGFSIPIDVVKRILPDLMASGTALRAYAGLTVEAPGRAATEDPGAGVLVREVDEQAPAAKAGLRVGDVIAAMDGIPAESPAEYHSLLETYVPGNTVTMTTRRGFSTLTRKVVLEKMPAGYGRRHGEKVFGLAVRQGRGLVLVEKVTPGSTAQRIGVRAGDLLAEVEGKKVATLEQYETIIEANLGRTPLRFLIVRSRKGYAVQLP
ncbi:MAG: trypsin-like peptidase domain-containing protein [Desulfobulbaceae bacterium]|nr:trypsin-like peptidase domain-containing protein [Desulfobulbaceae bacterium]